ncbi:MAG: signal peptidase II [Sphingobacteriaceae bacterium]|nr:MAG: signal peptidase II [Sphingobacteriaceae bacterium]
MQKRNKIILFIFLLFASLGVDRITKNLAKEHLMYQPTRYYLGDTFRLEYAENTGAALSLGDDLPQPYSLILLSIIPIIVMIGLTVYVFYNINKLNTILFISLTLIIAGGVGNIIDRILYDRHVTDFMNMGIGSLRTGIFNVADMCVTGGVIGILLSSFKSEKPKTEQVT